MTILDQVKAINLPEIDSTQSLVSVCIPTYNAALWIEETIQSVLDSTYTNLEIIVNDDASTDSTAKIVQSFDDPRLHLYRNGHNLGVPANWNRALEKASGAFIGLLNHDDLYGPFWIGYAVHILSKNSRIGWIATAARFIDGEGQTLGGESHFSQTGERSLREVFLCIARLNGFAPAYIARREVLETVGVYDTEAGPSADNDLYLRLAARARLWYSSNPHHAARRLHSQNLTHRWGLVAQTAEGLRMLNKAFTDDALPQELRSEEKNCTRYFYQKVLARAQELLEKGDLETVHQLIQLLHAHGSQSRRRPQD